MDLSTYNIVFWTSKNSNISLCNHSSLSSFCPFLDHHTGIHLQTSSHSPSFPPNWSQPEGFTIFHLSANWTPWYTTSSPLFPGFLNFQPFILLYHVAQNSQPCLSLRLLRACAWSGKAKPTNNFWSSEISIFSWALGTVRWSVSLSCSFADSSLPHLPSLSLRK